MQPTESVALFYPYYKHCELDADTRSVGLLQEAECHTNFNFFCLALFDSDSKCSSHFVPCLTYY